MSALPVYALLLDAVQPLSQPRADTVGWDAAEWDHLLRVAEWHRLAPLMYCHLASAPGVAGDVLAALEQAYHGPPLIGDEELVAIELHRHVTIPGEGVRFDIEDFWRRARPADDGRHMLLSPEDMLLHVCLHFTRNRLGGTYFLRHSGGALGQICDIARIVEHEPPDWGLLGSLARGYGLGARVFLGLFAARELGVPIPAAALADLEPSGFDPEVGRRLVALRVLREGDHLPARTLRWMFAPSRDVLNERWQADPDGSPVSLARAYMRRAAAHWPETRSALRRPMSFVHDRRLDGQIRALEDPR